MSLTKNKHGVVQYPKGDVRRLFVLLASIDKLERPTMTTLAEFTGHSKGNIDHDVQKISEQLSVKIVKDGPVYRIVDWGDIVKKTGVKRVFKGEDIDIESLTNSTAPDEE